MPIIFIIFSLAAVVLLEPILSLSSIGLSEQPKLTRAFVDSAAREKMAELGLSNIQLYCDRFDKHIGARFEFDSLDGRKPVAAAGETKCSETGAILTVKSSYLMAARENYDISMVNSELLKLMARAKIQPAVRDTSRAAAERVLSAKFRQAIASNQFGAAIFTCDKAGAPYRVYEHNPSGSRHANDRLVLKTTCVKAHQNFTVTRGLAADAVTVNVGMPLVYVEDYNAVPVSSIEAAFAEYIQDVPTKTTF